MVDLHAFEMAELHLERARAALCVHRSCIMRIPGADRKGAMLLLEEAARARQYYAKNKKWAERLVQSQEPVFSN